MQVLSKFYFHDTPEQDQRALEQQGLSGPMSVIRPGLQCGQDGGGGWGLGVGGIGFFKWSTAPR